MDAAASPPFTPPARRASAYCDSHQDQVSRERIIADVRAYVGDDFGLAFYTRSGALDSDFGTDGRVTTDFGSDIDLEQSVAVQSDGKAAARATIATAAAMAVMETTCCRAEMGGTC
jgi:hypothetical protein